MNISAVPHNSLPYLKTREKYSYVRSRNTYFQAIMLAYMSSAILLLYGYFQAYRNLGYTTIIAGLTLIVIVSFMLFSGYVALHFKKFDLKSHKKKVRRSWNQAEHMPSVDIFLPLCGEDIETVKNTWDGVKELCTIHGSAVKAYVLDDKGREDYRFLANRYGFTYLSRPNKGEMKKAGNIKYGTEHSHGDFIVIFDADFRPHKDFLYELLPYMSDTSVGIIQSPQYFDVNEMVHERSQLEYGAGHIQEYFYRVVQYAQSQIGGTICVGSNAVYRRAALESIGGTVQIDHSEDIWTGYKLVAQGWKVLYLPVILAKGVCPTDIHSYFKQQTRWCNGSLSLMVTQEFWTSPVSTITKLPYVAGFLFYISTVFILLLPVLNLLFLDPSQLSVSGWYFVPFSLLSLILMYVYVFRKARLATLFAGMIATWSYTYALFSTMLGISEGWQPSGSKHAVSTGYRNMTWMASIYYVVYCLASSHYVLTSTAQISIEDLITYFWIGLTVVLQGKVVYHLWSYIMEDYTFDFNSLVGTKLTRSVTVTLLLIYFASLVYYIQFPI